MVDEQLAAPLEQVRQRCRGAILGLEDVLLVEANHRQPAALGGQRVEPARERLLLDQELVAGGLPLLV